MGETVFHMAEADTECTCLLYTSKHDRDRQSHEIARELRPRLTAIGQRHDASIKVVEVPPGPPVMSPIVAEVYGPDQARTQNIARALEQRFRGTDGIVDVDTSMEAEGAREILVIDRARAARLGVAQSAITQAISCLLYTSRCV